MAEALVTKLPPPLLKRIPTVRPLRRTPTSKNENEPSPPRTMTTTTPPRPSDPSLPSREEHEEDRELRELELLLASVGEEGGEEENDGRSAEEEEDEDDDDEGLIRLELLAAATSYRPPGKVGVESEEEEEDEDLAALRRVVESVGDRQEGDEVDVEGEGGFGSDDDEEVRFDEADVDYVDLTKFLDFVDVLHSSQPFVWNPIEEEECPDYAEFANFVDFVDVLNSPEAIDVSEVPREEDESSTDSSFADFLGTSSFARFLSSLTMPSSEFPRGGEDPEVVWERIVRGMSRRNRSELEERIRRLEEELAADDDTWTGCLANWWNGELKPTEEEEDEGCKISQGGGWLAWWNGEAASKPELEDTASSSGASEGYDDGEIKVVTAVNPLSVEERV
ncbi:hypothetical protein ACHAWF_017228 [Thalassiosira exigua]